jgi:hypothetical protein
LTVSVGPFVLNTLHVPLVDDDNNSLVFAGVNLSEEILVSLVDKDGLELREEDVH